jgi:hypothetical protein
VPSGKPDIAVIFQATQSENRPRGPWPLVLVTFPSLAGLRRARRPHRSDRREWSGAVAQQHQGLHRLVRRPALRSAGPLRARANDRPRPAEEFHSDRDRGPVLVFVGDRRITQGAKYTDNTSTG